MRPRSGIYITVILMRITIIVIICLLIARSIIIIFIINIKHFFQPTKVSKKKTFTFKT